MVEGLAILESWSIPPRATTEIIETLAFALGFCISGCGLMFIPSTWFTGWRRPFEGTELIAPSYGTVGIKSVVSTKVQRQAV